MNCIIGVFRLINAVYRLRGYKPQKVTPVSLLRWVLQFPRGCRIDLIRMVANITFISEKETVSHLVELNRKVLSDLRKHGIGQQNIIYITTDDAASSSSVMLNLLRDHANLERAGFKILHSGEAIKIQSLTTELGRGAIVYVDDFAGSGKQFIRSRRHVAEYVVGTFSEFFLLPCICEEANSNILEIGVKPLSGFIHKKTDRPLLNDCEFLKPSQRQKLLEISKDIWGKNALGFKGLATNVVLYRNIPNTSPLIFRGNRNQSPYFGITPRYDDLPSEVWIRCIDSVVRVNRCQTLG